MAKDKFQESEYDLVLDAVCEPNRDVLFLPAEMTLRGERRQEWIRSDNINGAISQVGGVIPGQRMLVDTRTRHVKIIDRMTLPENRSIDERLRKLTTADRYRMGRFTDYEKDIDMQVSADEWPKWLYCMKRCVDHRSMTLVRGTLPELVEIRKMGRIVFDAGNLTPKDPKNPFNELLPPAKAELATAKA